MNGRTHIKASLLIAQMSKTAQPSKTIAEHKSFYPLVKLLKLQGQRRLNRKRQDLGLPGLSGPNRIRNIEETNCQAKSQIKSRSEICLCNPLHRKHVVLCDSSLDISEQDNVTFKITGSRQVIFRLKTPSFATPVHFLLCRSLARRDGWPTTLTCRRTSFRLLFESRQATFHGAELRFPIRGRMGHGHAQIVHPKTYRRVPLKLSNRYLS
ncbi:hypothetical protein C1752_01043 [Acaryochloris thomasi RCC1774]|uniref:Uncharacterized protein n=1 Tax=Acaryochloris thomasi RCC1774 TaxID=1764569 RepID=A0A2W1JZB5_9CYAN|nr:hypothetical protein C1752_01043 [Acaryochloris thomasi RCC1774]